MFFLGKLLAFAPWGNFLRGPFGKIVMGGALVGALAVGFMIWLASHDASIQTTSTLQFNQTQLTQTLNAQEAFNRKMTQLLQDQQNTLVDIINQRNDLRIKTNNLITRINNGEFKGGNSSEVLKQAVKSLGGK